MPPAVTVLLVPSSVSPFDVTKLIALPPCRWRPRGAGAVREEIRLRRGARAAEPRARRWREHSASEPGVAGVCEASARPPLVPEHRVAGTRLTCSVSALYREQDRRGREPGGEDMTPEHEHVIGRLRSSAAAVAAVLVAALWPSAVLAQGPPAGIVTALQGQATVARAALAEPAPLHFKDSVFVRDRITTRQDTVVRVLLGGRALVTVRELSVLTITEEAGGATINLTGGRVHL